MREVGKVAEGSIERAERFIEILKQGQVKGWVICAPLEGEYYKWWAGGDWRSTEMIGRLEVLQQHIVNELMEGGIDESD